VCLSHQVSDKKSKLKIWQQVGFSVRSNASKLKIISNDPSVTAHKPKTNYRFHLGAFLLMYILQTP
jgi:hypothetical protein